MILHKMRLKARSQIKPNIGKLKIQFRWRASGGSRISQMGGVPTPEVGGNNLLFDKMFCQKLHENGRNWTGVACIPSTPLDTQMRRSLVAICNQLSCYQPFWMAAITKNQKNGYHPLTFKIETCNRNQIPRIFNFNTKCEMTYLYKTRND